MIVQPNARSVDDIATVGDALPLVLVSSYWDVVHTALHLLLLSEDGAIGEYGGAVADLAALGRVGGT
jgi:hypothetical protein